jgi:hypothetical protein
VNAHAVTPETVVCTPMKLAPVPLVAEELLSSRSVPVSASE